MPNNVDRLLLSKISSKDLLRYEIIRKRGSIQTYKQLAQDLGFQDIKSMVGVAVAQDNVSALLGLAQANVFAVTNELQKAEYTRFFQYKFKAMEDNFIPELFFMVRSQASKNFKLLLRRLTRSIILRTSLSISGRGSRGKTLHRVRYQPGMAEFDFEETLFRYIQNRVQYLQMEDIIGLERRQQKRHVVLMLDTSGSMFGKLLLNAALTTSVLSYVMAKEHTSIILFNSQAFLLKDIREERSLPLLVDQILESEAMGFTNLYLCLKKGLEELHKLLNTRNKVGILITDGDYNRGDDPIPIASQYPHLHVINIPPIDQRENITRGQMVCRRLALAGRGHYYPVKEIHEIPRALMRILSAI